MGSIKKKGGEIDFCNRNDIVSNYLLDYLRID